MLSIKPTKEHFALALVVGFGLFLYLYKLDQIPSGFYVDEALTGYNAYSLLQTGKDEYGKLFPIALRFFGSYTPPLYTYLTIPIIALFGLNIASVRLLSVLSGASCIMVVYFLLKELNLAKSKFTPVIGAFLFALSPWNVFYSRVGYEVHLAFLIFSLGTLLTWIGINRKPKYIIYGFSLLSLSTYAAHTQKFLVPIVVVGLLVLFRQEFAKRQLKKNLYQGLIIALIIQIPNLYLLSTPAFFTKTSLFYYSTVISQAEKIGNLIPMLFSSPLAFTREVLSQFITYFSPRSLFFLGDADPQRSIPELSVFYQWMIIPYLLGLFAFWKNRKKNSVKYILLFAFTVPLPTTLVGDPFSTQRALPLLLPIIIIIGVGMDKLIYQKKLQLWVPIFIVLIATSLLLLWRSYFVLFPNERAVIWGKGFQQLAFEIKQRPKDNFVIDQARSKPAYIELLFFLKYPPEKFHDEVSPTIKSNYYTDTAFDQNYKFANIETRNIIWEEDIYQEQILVGDALAISEQQVKEHFLEKEFEIKSPLSETIFIGFRTSSTNKCTAEYNKVHCKGI